MPPSLLLPLGVPGVLAVCSPATCHLPATQEALVPDYLSAVPRDPFDGQPFRYSAEKRIVYSVGENLTDDGGDEGRERGRRRAKDLVFKLFTHEPETTAE